MPYMRQHIFRILLFFREGLHFCLTQKRHFLRYELHDRLLSVENIFEVQSMLRTLRNYFRKLKNFEPFNQQSMRASGQQQFYNFIFLHNQWNVCLVDLLKDNCQRCLKMSVNVLVMSSDNNSRYLFALIIKHHVCGIIATAAASFIIGITNLLITIGNV